MTTPGQTMIDHERGTGRTTYMIDEAIREARKGTTVFVIGKDPMHIKAMWDIATGRLMRTIFRWNVHQTRKTIEAISNENGSPLGKIQFATAEECRFNWDLMRCTTFGPDTLYFVDHHTIESRYRDLLSMLHRWDRRPEVPLPVLQEIIQGE